MENRSLSIHDSLASFSCFIYSNLFQQRANDTSNMVHMVNGFCQKLKIL